ncbi:Citrate lyase subunit beta-like protein [Corynebacterium deserti GIMN1.010]|uniref:Citrate lyase subunit beta-like protein n=1 Tax=Corynebacterium deserti GIMN1.010 TaxID=931089 RepID=A0A0M4CW51_9CORY|nr:CoA ester lyase [Corynebacterium deserti]ALC05312.1 Citrate lyase subunit beta-like protein [Corynebacterium deserti GIMN1.010]
MSEFICGPALLFAPAGRPEILPKAADRADMVIVDLEDGAGEVDRETAYATIKESGLDPARTIIRTVGPDDPNFASDVEMVKSTDYSLVMVPKVQASLPGDLDGLSVIAMVETPVAVINIPSLVADPRVVGMFWGAEDLTHLLGGTHSRFLDDEQGAGGYRDTMRFTRALMHIHAAAHGKFTIDAIHADFHDEDGQFREALDAARTGFAGTACIHPKQVETVRRAYRPEPDQVEWALRVVEEAKKFPGAFKLDGQMIDAPLISQAEMIISRQLA